MAWNTGNSYTTTSPVNAALMNGIGNDLRTWGGNVDAGGNNLANVAQLTTTGKVGIGMASPIALLDITDTSASDTPGSAHRMRFGYGASPLYGWRNGGGNSYLALDAYWSSWAVALAISRANNYVGIGTIAPTSPLQVVGVPTYASDAAAGTAGLTAGAFYKDSTGGVHVKL